jgi:hypothetical protein
LIVDSSKLLAKLFQLAHPMGGGGATAAAAACASEAAADRAARDGATRRLSTESQFRDLPTMVSCPPDTPRARGANVVRTRRRHRMN